MKILNRPGFSLFELLVVLAISFIILMIGIPKLEVFFQKSQSDLLSAQLLHAIALARNQASLENTIVQLCASLDGETCSGVWQQGFAIFANQKSLYRFQGRPGKGQLFWRAFPHNQPLLEWLPSGKLNNENGTFWYCPVKSAVPDWAIIINSAGRARLVLPDAKGNFVEALQC